MFWDIFIDEIVLLVCFGVIKLEFVGGNYYEFISFLFLNINGLSVVSIIVVRIIILVSVIVFIDIRIIKEVYLFR